MWPSEPGLRTTGLHELDRQSQPSWRGCHSQELQDQPLTFCIRFGAGCMFSTFFSMHSIGFLLRAKNTEVGYYVFLQTQGSVCGKWAAIHCSRWRRSSTQGWFYERRKAERGDWYTVGKANAVLREFYRSVVRKRELSNTAKLSVFKLVFVPILTYGHESWAMTERILTQVQTPKMGFLRGVHGVTVGLTEVRLRPGQETSLALPYLNLRSFGSKSTALNKKLATLSGLFGAPQWFAALVTPPMWHFATNCAVVKFAEHRMSKHFSELREHNHVSSAMYPQCPTKDWWGKCCWLNPRESHPNVVQGPGGVTSSPTLLGPVLVWSQQNYLKLLLIVRFSKSSYGCCPHRNSTFRSEPFRSGRFGLGRFGVGTFRSRHFCT